MRRCQKVDENLTYKKTTVYSFDAVTIQSECYRPAVYVEARRPGKQSGLIKVREKFKDKVMRSAGDP